MTLQVQNILMMDVVVRISNPSTIKVLIFLLFLSSTVIAQKNINGYVGVGARILQSEFNNLLAPSHLEVGYRISHFNEKFEVFVLGRVESNFKSYNNLGLGGRFNLWKKNEPKTTYIFLDGILNYFPQPYYRHGKQRLFLVHVGMGYTLPSKSHLEFGLGVDTQSTYFGPEDNRVLIKVAFIKPFTFSLSREKRFKQNPKKQLECPKVVSL